MEVNAFDIILSDTLYLSKLSLATSAILPSNSNVISLIPFLSNIFQTQYIRLHSKQLFII